MKTVYWCPFISKVATIRAVIRSAQSLKNIQIISTNQQSLMLQVNGMNSKKIMN